LKHRHYPAVIAAVEGPNNQNSERGIETIQRNGHLRGKTAGPNNQNSERGIETAATEPRRSRERISPNNQNPERGIETRVQGVGGYGDLASEQPEFRAGN